MKLPIVPEDFPVREIAKLSKWKHCGLPPTVSGTINGRVWFWVSGCRCDRCRAQERSFKENCDEHKGV